MGERGTQRLRHRRSAFARISREDRAGRTCGRKDAMMNERNWLAERFQLRPVAYRVLGALSEADDAVQEAWLRLSRAGIRPTQQNADKSCAFARAPSAFAPPSASGTGFPSPQV